MLFGSKVIATLAVAASLLDLATAATTTTIKTTAKTTSTTKKTTSTTSAKASSSTKTSSSIKTSSAKASSTLVISSASSIPPVSVVTAGTSAVLTTVGVNGGDRIPSISSSVNPVTTAVGAPASTGSAASAAAAVATGTTNATVVGGQTVANTILIFARDSTSAKTAYSGLEGYGIPYDVVIVPQNGITLPELNSSTTQGNYGGIIILSEVSYELNATTGVWGSAITTAQFAELYAYQVAFGVRMVRIDVYPTSDFGATTAIASTGCCAAGVEQLISISNSSGFPTANMNIGATMTTQSIFHYPAVITDSSTTWEVAQFAPDSAGQFTDTTTAAVINNFNGRQQFVWFTSWATSWSATSTFLQHAHIHWMTRGMFLGARKIYLGTQVDDVHLTTDIYSPAGKTFRLRPSDLDNHVSWMQSINSRLPAGSNYFMELGHNGNGDFINATNIAADVGQCTPDTAIYYDGQNDTALEFQKPLGSGYDQWPTTPKTYTWSLACAQLDKLASWFMVAANRDAFAHISHTFTHLNLDNATYNDATKEISWNVQWLKQVGISAGKFTANGIIPPAITGMHNGDVIRAWMDNGITQVVGDNSRPILLNPYSEWWPLISNVSSNGYAGLTIIPRWPSTIYYNCDLPACTTAEWINTSAGHGGFADLLDYERTTTSRYLLALRQDPYMFHQANLRAADVPGTVVGSQTVYSLIQIWTETVTQEMMRLTSWPIVTLQHKDFSQKFIDRMTRDKCNPNFTYSYSSDGSYITGGTLTANGNTCGAPIPVTFPVAATSSSTTTSDQVGGESLILWANLTGSPVTFTLSTPIAVL